MLDISILANRKIIAVIIALLLLIIPVFFYLNEITRAVLLDNSVTLKINKGASLDAVTEQAGSLGLIRHPSIFKLYVRQQELTSKLRAGEYVFTKSVTIKDLAQVLTKGDKKSGTKKITLPEGWSATDMDKYFAEIGIFEAGLFSRTINNPGFVLNMKSTKDFLRDLPQGTSLEGYFFPDTYNIYENSTVEDVAHKLLLNFGEKFTQKMRQEAFQQGRSLNQVVAMASIIEKEVRKPEDMKIVSGIFWRRIANGQPLQSCATLAYILGVNKPQYSIEDTKINSPYNTYQNKGLPPGPISNPGLMALEAAINPTITDYNYFLTASLTGKTIFSRTFEEHVLNKKKYLK